MSENVIRWPAVEPDPSYLDRTKRAQTVAEKVDYDIAARPLPSPGITLRGRHLKRVERRGQWAAFIKAVTPDGSGGGGELYLDREAIEKACLAMGIQIVRPNR